MTRFPALLLFALTTFHSSALPASALQCARREAVIAALADRYGETPQALGLGQNGFVMELHAAPSGSWTITITRPDGITCLLAAGDNFQPLTPPPPGDPA